MKKVLLFLSAFVLLMVPGCAHYKARPLKKLNVNAPTSKNEQFLALSYTMFDCDDCIAYLGRDLLAQGYQPVQIEFTNHSKYSFYLSENCFNIPQAPIDVVAKLVYTDTTGRAVGYGVAGLFIWPLVIPAIVDGIGSAQANEQLDTDFARKALCDRLVTKYNSANGLIFVPVEEFNPNFTLTVTSIETDKEFILSPKNSRITLH